MTNSSILQPFVPNKQARKARICDKITTETITHTLIDPLTGVCDPITTTHQRTNFENIKRFKSRLKYFMEFLGHCIRAINGLIIFYEGEVVSGE